MRDKKRDYSKSRGKYVRKSKILNRSIIIGAGLASIVLCFLIGYLIFHPKNQSGNENLNISSQQHSSTVSSSGGTRSESSTVGKDLYSSEVSNLEDDESGLDNEQDLVISKVESETQQTVSSSSQQSSVSSTQQNNNSNEASQNSQQSIPDSSQSTSESTKVGQFSNWNEYCDWNLIVINSENKVPDTFHTSLGYCKGMQVDVRIVDPLSEMIDAAAKDGISLWLSSGYRGIDLQTTLFSREVQSYLSMGYSEHEAENLAKQAVAMPGTSEHHTGLAVDLNGVRDDFCYTKEYDWLLENAASYGFILRYPEEKKSITKIIFEPWHFRYVGKEHAQKMKSQNVCLEEYIQNLM